jgi:hypothetical protein
MRHLICLFLTIVLTTTILGQQSKIRLGIETGPSIVFLRSNPHNSQLYTNIGFSGGLSFQYNFSKLFSLVTGVSYERKGSRIVGSQTNNSGVKTSDWNFHNNFNYLTTPLLFCATFGNKVKFFVQSGVFIGYLLKQTIVYKHLETPEISGLPRNSDLTNYYKRLDFGISGGLGILIPIKSKVDLSIATKNNFGLLNVNKDKTPGSIKTTSMILSIGFSYKFNSHKTEENKAQ